MLLWCSSLGVTLQGSILPTLLGKAGGWRARCFYSVPLQDSVVYFRGFRFNLLLVIPWCRWLGWQAHVTVDPWTGLSLHDVSFKGERIAYEIGVQDQFVA